MQPIDKREYLQIGELAKMYNISVQALRYYDRIGFLKPLYIDPNTHYRYYSRNQGFLVRNKKLLQAAGFSLAEIKDFLNKKNLHEIVGLYKRKREDLDGQIKDLHEKKKQIGFYLDFFNGMLSVDRAAKIKGIKDIGKITLKNIPLRRKVCIRERLVFDYSSMMLLYNQLIQIIFENQLRVEKNLITMFHGGYLDIYHTKVDIELCMIVANASKRTQGTEQVPYEHFVSCIHKGKYPSSIKTYEKMLQWVDKKRYTVTGPVMHVLLVPIAAVKPPEDTIFEIRLPVGL